MRRIILAAEIAVIVLLLALSFGKRKEYTIGADEFTYCENAGQEEAEEHELMYYAMDLKMGAYEISVDYDASVDAEYDNSMDVSLGRVNFDGGQDDFKGDDITYLPTGRSTMQTRIWVRTFGKANGFTIRVIEGNIGALSVEKVTIRENLAFRVIRIAGFLLVFALFDFLYVTIFESTGISREQRKFIIGITAITVFSSMVCFMNYLYTGHDGLFHLQRIARLAESLRNGLIPQRIEFSALNGYGYASPLFYGEALLAIPAMLYNCFVPLQTAYQIYAILVNFGTASICCWCFYKMSKNCNYSLIAAFAYTCSAYRLTNLLVRVAVGEYTAMMFLPLIVYGLWYICTSPDEKKFSLRELLPLIIGLTGIIQTHILTCEMFAEFIFLFVLIMFKRVFKRNRFAGLLKSCIWTLALNLWFIIPFLQSMAMGVVVNQRAIYYIKGGGSYLAQLFNPFHTVVGISQTQTARIETSVSVGAALIIAIILFLACCVKRREWKLTGMPEFKESVFYGGIGLLAVFMSSYYFPWDFFQGLSGRLARIIGTVQFSWRYMAFAACLLSFMLLRVLGILDRKVSKPVMYIIAVLMLSTTVMAESKAMMDVMDLDSDGAYYSEVNLPTMWVSNGEYLLTCSNRELWKESRVEADASVTVNNYTDDENIKYLDCTVTGGGDHEIILPVWAYDNYHAYADGAELDTAVSDDGRLAVYVNGEYDGRITVEYTEPVLWKICNYLSLLALVLIVVCCAARKKNTQEQAGF